MAVTFQLAHCVEEADFASAEQLASERRIWAVHEVETTVDFCPRNAVLSWVVGGLNFQIEHHLFPRVPHTHYPQIAKIVQRNAERHGVRYVTQHSLRGSAPVALQAPSHDGAKRCPSRARHGLISGRARTSVGATNGPRRRRTPIRRSGSLPVGPAVCAPRRVGCSVAARRGADLSRRQIGGNRLWLNGHAPGRRDQRARRSRGGIPRSGAPSLLSGLLAAPAFAIIG